MLISAFGYPGKFIKLISRYLEKMDPGLHTSQNVLYKFLNQLRSIREMEVVSSCNEPYMGVFKNQGPFSGGLCETDSKIFRGR